jgi:indole-3-glycerol phosphate synthase
LPETQGPERLPGILSEIVDTKRAELTALAQRASELEEALSTARAPRDFLDAVSRRGTVSLIAECKRRSPGAGDIRPDLDAARMSGTYEAAGAAAISVLTDATYFGGSVDDLRDVSKRVSLPILRKDFTLDTLHLIEARSAGADAILLIARILDDPTLDRLQTAARALGMAALVEVHDEREMERALSLGARLVGINNRDLSTFATDLDTTLRLIDSVPSDVVVVSESGIRTRADVERLGAAGVDGILVGEALLRGDDSGTAVAELTRVANRPRGR